MRFKIGSAVVSLFALAFVAMGTSSAQAYGPEGLFGGRAMPDSTIVLGNPVELKNDRPQRAESVIEHPRPDYDAAPISVGSFELFPSMEVGQTYDSNIYASHANRKDDVVNTIRPVVNVFSNWGKHALSMTTFGDVNIYDTHSHEDYQNFVSDWNARYDVMTQSFVSVRGGFQHLTESRSSPDAVNGSEPTTFDLAKTGFGFYRGIGAIKVGADYDLRRFDYNNTKSSAGMIDESGRNRYEHIVSSKVSYDLSGNVKPYVRASFNDHDYDKNRTRLSNGYDAVIGSTFDMGGITSVDVYVGAMGQNYSNFTANKDVVATKFGGRLDWNVTGLTSVVLETSRTIEDTSVSDFSSYVATGGSATVTHELMKNLLVEGDFGFTRDDFVGSASRQDDDIMGGAGLRYLMNRHIYSDLFYNWNHRYSTDSLAEYYRNLVMLRLGYRI